MMEGVDCQLCAEDFFKNGTPRDGHLMGWITAVLVLAMLDADALHLCVDILVECSSKGCIDDLDAFADAQHGNLTVIRQTSQQ